MKKKQELTTLQGQDIEELSTINSMYADGQIRAVVGKEEYRFPVSVIKQMLNEFIFDVEMKKKYKHIVGVNWDKTDEMNFNKGD